MFYTIILQHYFINFWYSYNIEPGNSNSMHIRYDKVVNGNKTIAEFVAGPSWQLATGFAVQQSKL